MLHGKLAIGIVIYRVGTDRFVQHLDWRRAVDIGAAGNQYATRGSIESSKRFQQIESAEHVYPVELLCVPMSNKRHCGEMHNHIRLSRLHCAHGFLSVGEIARRRTAAL